MFNPMRRYFGTAGPSILKNLTKRQKKMAKNLNNQEEVYPEFKTLAESIAFKKDATKSLWKNYDPVKVEKDWDQYWVENKYFHCDAEVAKDLPKEDKFIICWPPSNVTGYLHAGHAITGAIEDCMSRYHRMKGRPTLFVPGVDHAGIATQTVVEKKLAKKGISRFDLGREKFIEEVYNWKDHSCDRICEQLRKMGMSMDWDRFTFTMDDVRYKAVLEAFIRLKNEGIIYRANRLVNWSCTLNSAISNIEVDKEELTKPTKIKVPGYDKPVEFGVLIEFAYKVKGTDRELIVATTRLETMLGDVAVAVHPEDERYKDLIGKELEHPFIPDRKMTVVADDVLVDMEFGTGAVKVTPAHDENDFNCGVRNNLEFINILDDHGILNKNAGKYQGMKRYDARVQVQKDLEALGLYKGKKPNPMILGICSRSKDIVEPLIKPQWYVKMTDELQAHMLGIVETDEMHIVPAVYKKKWNGWINDLRDWCISRQLWWGHRIPAYIPTIKGQDPLDPNQGDSWICAHTEEEALKLAAEKHGVPAENITLKQDEDVLDTWFSSALFAFSIAGWPEDTVDMKAFFPNTILETGHDILFFWIARMVIMSYYLLDKQIPFRKVFLHSMVRDETGEKMSKSKGNIIDPLEVIDGCSLEEIVRKIQESTLSDKEKKRSIAYKKKKFKLGMPKCGSDTLRYGLLSFTHHAKDINLDLNKLLSVRQFCNKIWNTFKYVTLKLGGDFQYNLANINPEALTLADKWILAELTNTFKKMNELHEGYHYHELTTQFEEIWVDKFCNVYLEYSKLVLDNPERALTVKTILFHVIESGLRLLHPLMPFISEELYQKLPEFEGKIESICIAQYPEYNADFDFEGVGQFNDVIAIVGKLRSILGSVTLPGKTRPEVYITISGDDAEAKALLVAEYAELIALLTKTTQVRILDYWREDKSKLLT